MPVFRYKAVSGNGGDVLRGEIEAASRELAVARLQSMGRLLISAEEIGAKRLFNLKRLLVWRQRNRINRQDVALFCRELATLVQAGLPLEQALQTLGRLNQAAPMQRLSVDLLDKIRGGASLSGAMADIADVFDPLYINMVRAGEASGALDVVIGRLADYLERMAALRAYVISALIYPAILLGFAVLSLLVLMDVRGARIYAAVRGRGTEPALVDARGICRLIPVSTVLVGAVGPVGCDGMVHQQAVGRACLSPAL